MKHRSLISHIKKGGLASPDKEDIFNFEAGVKRGKIFVPTYTDEEQEEMNRKAKIAEKVNLDHQGKKHLLQHL